MTEIIPALMPDTFEELRTYARQFKDIVPGVQVDVMDGKFVPPLSWPYTESNGDVGAPIESSDGLPFWKELDYEIDLMVDRPDRAFEQWVQSGAKRIIVHFDALDDPEQFFTHEIFTSRRSEFLRIGVALHIDTPNESIDPYMEYIDFVQCMGIARVGYQGEDFDPQVLHKIQTLRERYPDLIISVDGGVSFENAKALVDAGANRLVSGSAILESDDPRAAVARFHALTQENYEA